MSTRPPTAPTQAGRIEAGFVGGVEVLPFGLLIFVAAALLITNAWAVIDTKMATSAAAREAARTYVESAPPEAVPAARTAALEVISNYGKRPEKLYLSISGSEAFERCDRITAVARYQVPAFSLPFGIGFGHGFTVESRHSEIIDPLRSGLGAASSCGY